MTKKAFQDVSPQVDFPAMERRILDWWYNEGIVKKYLMKNDQSTQYFSFLDGPITANNPMGVHHAWGRTYKDLWQRFYTMKGYKQRYQNGFDCQGLWVEVEVEKELGIRNKKDIENLVSDDKKASIAKFVQLCKERVQKFSAIQTEQSKRLGYFMDWEHSYYTMSEENNYMIWHFLKECFNHGWIYKGTDSVPWCPRCETAISQHEMLTEDYKELTHETVFVKLAVQNSPFTLPGMKQANLLVWTTTPWTVPANVAVGINTKYTYALWQHKSSGEGIIILDKDDQGNIPQRELKGKTITIAEYIFSNNLDQYEKILEIAGKELIGVRYAGPFDDMPRVEKARDENPETFHTVVDGSEIVTSLEGTGLLHVAPGAGKEDFDLGKKEKLPVISVIADDASYLPDMGDFSGKNAKKHPEIILDELRTRDGGRHFFKTMHYTHRYPACWRCKAELVWKVTDEWYIAMDKISTNKTAETGKTLREMMIDVAKKIQWIPSFGLDREIDWLKNMHDWLISKKNRYWGLALPIYECAKCQNFEVIGSREELKQRAISGWDEFDGHTPHKPFIDDIIINCTACNMPMHRIEPVGNPWLDAGIVPFSTIAIHNQGKPLYEIDRDQWQKWFPVNFITESFPGQFKNWFYAMIAMSTVLEYTNPFKTVLGFGTLFGEDGRPMHKSWGNAVEFNEGADKMGVDVMRWMYVLHNPENNLLFGYKKADETRRQFHLIVWNIYNFFITYANNASDQDFMHELKKNPGHQLTTFAHPLDQWIYSRLQETIQQVEQAVVAYEVQSAALCIASFVDDLSLWYVRRSRERLSQLNTDTGDNRSAFVTLYTVLVEFTKLIAPFVPFMAEEMYKNLTGNESVHLENWPTCYPKAIHLTLQNDMVLARTIVEQVHAVRKTNQLKIRQPLQGITYASKTKLPDSIEQIIADEVNVKKVVHKTSKDEHPVVTVDTTTTPALQEEGEAREMIRRIQVLRKEAGLSLTDTINIQAPQWPATFEEMIKQKTLAKSMIWGQSLSISKS